MMTSNPETRFACDAMLGGLARWLRAAGYDASWHNKIDDHTLIQQSQEEGRTLLSCDGGIFLFRVIRDHHLPALFVPRRLKPQEQLAHVLSSLNLPLRPPRCMACGGSLIEVAKEAVRDRAPARTFAWLDQFWECKRCRKLFWHGTHWLRIQEQLQRVAASINLP